MTVTQAKMPTISDEFDFTNVKNADLHPSLNAFDVLHDALSFSSEQHESGNFLLSFVQSFGWSIPQHCSYNKLCSVLVI